jgi:hypothetical protein
MAKKKKDKFENLLSKEQQQKLQDMANEMLNIAASVVTEYSDDDLDLSSLGDLTGSLENIKTITRIHEDSPFLDDMFKGDSWKKVIKSIPSISKKRNNDDTK